MIISPYKVPIDLSYTSTPRKPGIHLSGIIRPAALATGALDKKYADPGEDLNELFLRVPPEEVQNNGRLLLAIIGFAWEEWLAKQLARVGVEHHPGEMVHEGVIMNPDGVGCDYFGFLLHEIKFTFKSSKKPIQDHVMWIWQMCGYLRAMTELYGEFCNRAVIHPFHIKGDYKGIEPHYRPVMLTFDKEEIDKVWEMLMLYKHLAIPEGPKEQPTTTGVTTNELA